MIVLHKLGHGAERFYLAPDLIVTVEANPDTVITLTTGAKMLVVESPQEIVELVRASRVGVLVDALEQREQERAGEPWTERGPRGELPRPDAEALRSAAG
jgi:flagellar protein FlbD